MDFQEAEIFLENVKSITYKIPSKEKTFMEVAGYPHFENVCSNILAFYLNPNEEHKLNDLVVSALLKVVSQKNGAMYENIDVSYFNVHREFATINGNRIDIVMQNEDMVIGIENKIDATVYNNLYDYSETLDKLGKNSIKILLSLNDEKQATIHNDFINITYGEFFEQIRADLRNSDYIKNKWHIYLIDFMNNLMGFEVEKNMEQEINNWINNHITEIEEFTKLLNFAKSNINKKLEKYERIMQDKTPKARNIKYYYDENGVSTTAYMVFDIGCNLDVKLSTDGWDLGIFVWRKSSGFKVKELLNRRGKNYTEEERHLWIYHFDYDSEINEVVDKAMELYNIIKMCNT